MTALASPCGRGRRSAKRKPGGGLHWRIQNDLHLRRQPPRSALDASRPVAARPSCDAARGRPEGGRDRARLLLAVRGRAARRGGRWLQQRDDAADPAGSRLRGARRVAAAIGPGAPHRLHGPVRDARRGHLRRRRLEDDRGPRATAGRLCSLQRLRRRCGPCDEGARRDPARRRAALPRGVPGPDRGPGEARRESG